MNFETVKMGVAQKSMFFISDRQENFFSISRTSIKQNTASELKERIFIKYILQKTFLLKYDPIPIFCCTKNYCTPAYGEIVELMPRPAYGMKGEENLDM